MNLFPFCTSTKTLPFTYELIVHILREKVEHEDEFENLMS